MTPSRRLILALGAACLGAALTQCGSTTCDAASCPTGCCDGQGVCRPGTSHWYCGGEGEACATCPEGARCTEERLCVASPAAVRDGGGNGGGGGGGGGGADAGCRSVAVWPSTSQAGGYVPPTADYNWASLYVGDPTRPSDGGYDELYLEEYYFGGLTVPHAVTFSSTDTYLACETCLSLFSGCDLAGRCAAIYFAQAGTGAITAATRNARAGTMVAQLAGLRLVEWDYGTDAPVPGGGCVTIGSAAWNASWDAGPPDGGGRDGGVDGGSDGGP